MSDQSSVESPSPSNGHPHDLLARLYREIGISAVAAALEVSYSIQEEADATLADDRWGPLGENIAA
jgi:hypothetical protein